ncbi:MAG: hypothetical protein C0423_14185 [Methylibium sp.]|nr:hypothetical protein [Methylibium sp.]
MQNLLIPATCLLAWLMLASCSSPPQPPTVDEAHRRPVNSQPFVELQVCKHDLHNSRLRSAEAQRSAQSAAAALARTAALHQVLVATQPRPAQPPLANSVFTVNFDFGSARVSIPPDLSAALVNEAKNAPLVLLRGRTDGASNARSESRLASERATAVRDYLVAAGVDPARIRTTYQPIGDHAADNDSPSGRRSNRRVEIELYRQLPVAANVATPTQP